MRNFQKIEDSIKLLSSSMWTVSELWKPTLLHSINVWINLLNYWYEDEIIIAWFLHDIIEDTTVTQQDILSKFWERVCCLIQANTKDITIFDSKERDIELMARCSKHWKEAMIIKAVDLLENRDYFSKTNNKEKQDRIFYLWGLFLSVLPDIYEDEVFSTIRKIFTN